MAWEKRASRRYFYRALRTGGRVRKLYYGAGLVGQLAAATEALRRAEDLAQQQARSLVTRKLEEARALTRRLGQGCGLLLSAQLLVAGYHRPRRHAWRIWVHGRKALGQAAR